ncbi:MAG TPA: cytochrome P460 family protein [Candidatus Limnocylindria bacterium]|jgi:hypothetical protein|nr:cytochrome P460 family protein [Candidatus Limnocylindria bacterium]
MSKLAIRLCLLLLLATAGCHEEKHTAASEAAPSANDVLKEYARWTKVSPPNYRVSAWLAELCITHPTSTVGTAGPHADVPVAVFVNPRGLPTMTNGIRSAFPPGSVVVKAKYRSTSQEPDELGIMIKHEAGYSAENGDWEYAFITVGKPATFGQESFQNCRECHRKQKATDFIFAAYAKTD